MRIHPRHAVRACLAAGLALTAFPAIHAPWLPAQPAKAAPFAIRGLSPALISQAAQHPLPVVMVLRPGTSPDDPAVQRILRSAGATNVAPLDLINGISAEVTSTALDALRQDHDLLEIGVDQRLQPLPDPHGNLLNEQLAHTAMQVLSAAPAGQTVISEPDTLGIIHADQAQKLYDGRGVRVAIIDSGIDLGHPDLQNVLLKGPDGKALYQDFTGTDLQDTVGHGTAVAGTIAAQGRTVYSAADTYPVRMYPQPKPGQRFSDRTYFTFTGVAPGVKLMIAKVFDTRGNSTFSAYVRAIEWAVRNHADVINESWGYPSLFYSGSDLVPLADEAAVRAGVTVVVSNGNDGPGLTGTNSPAQAPDVIAVGASTDFRQYAETGTFTGYGAFASDSIASFSSRGVTATGRSRPDLVAPGDTAWTTWPHNGGSEDGPTSPPYAIGAFGGTSQAAPVTVGVAAMVINAYMETHGGRHPSPAYVKQVLTSSADDLGYGALDQGAGRVDAMRAVDTVIHKGPSLLLSGAIDLEGMPGQQLSQRVSISNTGTATQQISFAPQVLRQTQALQFGGMVAADNLFVYHFKVPPGVTTLSASANFDSQKNVPLPNGEAAKTAVLQIDLYDPHNNLVNYEQSVLPDATFDNPGFAGSGFTGTSAGRPAPGLWTAVVLQAPERDKHQVRHYINLPFTGRIQMYSFFAGGGSVTPQTLTVRPGQTAHALFVAAPQNKPGVIVVTLHLRQRSLGPALDGTAPATSTATIPVVLTADIHFVDGAGLFDGSFSGGVGTQGFARETRYFTYSVPPGVPAMQVSIAWQHRGNLYVVALIDPTGKIINLEDNSLRSSNGGLDLSLPVTDAYLDNPLPGRWHLAIYSLISAGLHPTERFRGVVEFGRPRIELDRPTITTKAGAGPVSFDVRVTNTGAGLQGYFSYATTDLYQYVALGGGGGTIKNGLPSTVTSTQVVTYTTNFVPPGTREVVTQAQALNSRLPVEVELDDSQVGSYKAIGLPGTVALGGRTGPGYVADVRGTDLPIGNWLVLLSLPSTQLTGPVYVASTSYAYALAPQPWVQMDAQLQTANLTFSSNPLIATPGGTVTFHGTVSVPADTAPGTYHTHLFIYTARLDQLADLPLTVTVSGEAPKALPTPDPLLATIASTQYFPEGATANGLTDQMDLVNPTDVATHAQIRLLSDTGWTTVTRYALRPHSRLSVNMQSLVGKDQGIAAVVQGDQPIVSGRLIARAGAAGTYSVGTTAPATRWYFADGYTVGTFAEYLEVVNPNAQRAHVHLHLVSDQGDLYDMGFSVDPSARGGVKINDLLSGKAVSATLTSDVPVVAERTQLFGTDGQGVTTAIGATAGSISAYIDPGHLPRGTQAHISLYNPHRATAHVQVVLLDSHGQTARTLALRIGGGGRATLDLTAKYGTANLGARITSDVAIVAEKVGYFGNFARSEVGGSDLLAVAAPAAALAFPGGTTANGAGDYLSLYNPSDKPATATVTVLYGHGQSLQHTVTLVAGRRTTINIASLGVPPGPSSLIVEGQAGAQLYATQTIMNAAHTDGSELSGVPLAAQQQ